MHGDHSMELADKQYQPVTGDQKIKLDDRLAVQERARRELSAKMAEKEKEAEYLQAALVEHQQGIQQMSDQLWEIYGSTAWKLVKLLWRVRLALLPHGSWTEKQVRRLFRRGGPAAVNPANEDL